MYYKNDAFDTPENMKFRRLIKEIMDNNCKNIKPKTPVILLIHLNQIN